MCVASFKKSKKVSTVFYSQKTTGMSYETSCGVLKRK